LFGFVFRLLRLHVTRSWRLVDWRREAHYIIVTNIIIV
jgi:hypothetical protein